MLINCHVVQRSDVECQHTRSPFPLTGGVPLLFQWHVFCVFKYSAVINSGEAAVPWCIECL